MRPAACHFLASWIREHGYSVKVIDFCSLMNTQDLVNITLKHVEKNTIAIGVSTTFWRQASEAFLSLLGEPDWVLNARRLIEPKHKLNWLLGGAQTYQITGLKFTWQTMHGFGEDPLLLFMDKHSSNKVPRKKYDIQTAFNSYVDDLGLQSAETPSMEMGRGCQFKCTFCSYSLIGKKKGTYLKDFVHIENELRSNFDRYGITRYNFIDDTVNESEEKIQTLADIAQRLPFKLEWVGYNRLDLIGSKKSTIQTLKDSGLKSAFFGIESFHKDASKIIGKGWNGVRGKDFLLELKQSWGKDINFHLAFIAGLPGETEKDLDETQQWCIDNKMPSWHFSGLKIRRQDAIQTAWPSEFSKNNAKFGFKFPHPLKPTFWENGSWNADTAKVKAEKLSAAVKKIGVSPAVWRLAEIATLGFTFDEVMNKKESEFDYRDLHQRNQKFIQNYVDFQLKREDN